MHRLNAMDALDVKVLCWNVFHGRDQPPNPALQKRIRLSPRTRDDGAYLQVGHTLDSEFIDLIARADWSICMLQETPPRWTAPLARAARAESCRALTSRNQLRFVTAVIARLHPDLIGSWEGGANLTLVRPPWRIVPGSDRTLLLNTLRERRLRERRRMGFARLVTEGERSAELCVANLHTGHPLRRQTEREVRRAAAAAVAWAGETPLVIGGDFNVRPRASKIFDPLETEHGLRPVTSPDAIDHVLVRGLDVVTPPAPWPAERRELELPFEGGTRRVRLSDHAPVEAVFRIPPS